MSQVDLQEYQQREYSLSDAHRDALLSEKKALDLTIEPVMWREGTYTLRPGSTVGAVEIGDLSVLIQPKIGIPQLLSLACYAMEVYKPQVKRLFDFEEEQALPDTLALALHAAARRAFSRGLLHGYRTEEEALHTVRGRIRFADQIRQRFGIPLPIEVRYDEFTDDITENQLVKAAVARLGGMRLRSRQARRNLGWIAATLENVSPVEFAPKDVPDVTFDRLNEHYRGVVGLSRLILRHSAFESKRGEVRATGFLMDMNVLFQEFVTVALREALGVSEHVLYSDKQLTGNRRIYLAEPRRVSLEPDLTWWDGETCTFVGDAKYKRVSVEGVPNADLYQLLAYATALDLPGGLLIYAQGEAETATYTVRNSGKRLEVAALELGGPLDVVLAKVDYIADQIRVLRDEALALDRAA
ncbi:MAG: restriction endonuclease [Dehalococcoidia bacterium]|nr:restriction endonuclease [Dehalococcoidia bacterium]